MGFLPTIRQRFQSDLQYRLGLVAYVPILCLGVLAAGGLIFLRGSTGVRVFGIFGLLGIALSAYVAHRIIKSILDSLDQLAGSARQLVSAQEELLDNNAGPIEAWPTLDDSSSDELGVLAGAINSMHRNTLGIDRNQNESIKKGISNIVINLARRSQALLDRQVEYIDQLENTEEDPDRLEQMFKVDHLATRMRRNAESLLVLAEADPGRRRGGPVDVADVLRVAMGEIENYQHIELTSVEPGQVTAAAAVDLAHMTAELMENATQFSPPDAPVEVSGQLQGSQYVISIVDHGMGMPQDQVDKANATLSDPPELGLAMGRSLGFVVIGRLAQRIGARVELKDTANSGTTAQIGVPTSVFTQVGDNSGVRRSVVAPESPEPDVAAVEDQGQSRSPALSKLLGLDVASLSGGGDGAAAVADRDTEDRPAVATESADQETWTPPPVTPDAPISLPSEVAAAAATAAIEPSIPLSDPVGVEEQAASFDDAASVETVESLPVEPEAVERPTVEASTVETPASETPASETPAVEAPTVESSTVESPIGDGDADVDATEQSPVPTVMAEAEPEPVVVESGDNVDVVNEARATQADDGSTPTSEQQAETWSPPAVSDPGPGPETVVVGEAPSKLEDAIPTGEAFESGMASLLEDANVDDAPSPDPGSDAADDARPQATSSGLTRRKRGQSKVPIGEGRPVAASTRNPEEIRSMLSRYRDGIKGNKAPADPGEEG